MLAIIIENNERIGAWSGFSMMDGIVVFWLQEDQQEDLSWPLEEIHLLLSDESSSRFLYLIFVCLSVIFILSHAWKVLNLYL